MESPKRYFIYCNDSVNRYGAVCRTESTMEHARQDLIRVLTENNGLEKYTMIVKAFDVTGYGVGLAEIIQPSIVADMIDRLHNLDISPFYEGTCIVNANGNFVEIAAIRNRKNLT